MKKWFRYIIYVLIVSAVCAFFILEGGQLTEEEDIAEEDYFTANVDDIQNNEIGGSDKKIACWGDSITFGLGSSVAVIHNDDEIIDVSGWSYTEALSYYTGLDVYNLGVCGETSYEIALRQGGIKMYIDRTVTVKPGKRARINIIDENGATVMLENFNGYQTNNDDVDNVVYINNIPFVISYGKDYMYISLCGNNNNQSVRINKGSRVITKAEHDIQSDIVIIQMGSNGGWDSYEELINQYKAMIANSGTQCYIIIGDTDNPDESIDSSKYETGTDVGLNETFWEAALREEFGEHFINMRTYLLENALEISGLEADEDDLYNISQGRVPEIIKEDYTHLNSYGYYVMGVAVYEKGLELGYW